MKRLVAFTVVISMLLCCALSAQGYSNKEEITAEEGSLLEGLFTGKTFEEEIPELDDLGGYFGMHFPDFVWVDGVLYSYYINGKDGKSTVGLATSTDGVHFEDKGVVIDADAPFDRLMAAFAGVWYEDGVFYVTYEALPETDDGANIALATSTDGVHFDKKGVILTHDRSLDWQNYNIGTPDLYKVGDMWYMTFHGFGRAKKDCQIGVAYGTDIMNLTMVDHPVIETSNNPDDPDCGTCGRRDVIYYDGWYYMVYEISTDGGKINRNLGDDLGVEGRYYYDFGGSNWGHKFARSKDMINWEKLPYLLHDTYKGDYAFDGPAWLIRDGQIFIYYRNVRVHTSVIRLTSAYKTVTDETSGISAQVRKDADFSVKRLSGGGLYDSLKDTRSIAMFRAYEIAASKNGQPSDEPLECSAPLPDRWSPSKTAVVKIGEDGSLCEVSSDITEKDGKTFVNFTADSNGSFALVHKKTTKAGDLNFDGKTTAVDALMALRAAVEKQNLEIFADAYADMNKNGRVDVADALLILSASVGKS